MSGTRSALTLLLAGGALLLTAAGHAEEPPTEARPEPGTWRFKHPERPVKAIILGGSVTAWQRGNFGHFLQAACPRVEVVNRGKAKLGAPQLRQRFHYQVVKNRRVNVADHEAVWLLFQPGLNSIATPEMTNKNAADIFQRARKVGIKTIGLTSGPWGSQNDKRRWRYARGLKYQDFTRRVGDFLLGRSTPAQALGSWARGRSASWRPGELPDLAVDLYDSPLRDAAAELVEEEVARRYTEREPYVRAQLNDLPAAERAAALDKLVARVQELPRWFMKRELHAFDHIHPNMDGHRIMAQTICAALPKTWACDCGAMASMSWSRKARSLTPLVESRAAQ